MSTNRIPLDVEYEDGTTVHVSADQRDFAIWERQERCDVQAGAKETPSHLVRVLAYCALKRTGQIDPKLTQAAWDATAIQVSTAGGEPESPADPTQPEASAGSPRRSPSGRAKASAK